MASFYNVEQEAVGEDLEAIFTGQTKPLRQYGLDLTEATLQEWAMKQGIDANINSMSQAEKTMLRYQYVMANTGAAQGDFIRTADTWANQVRVLKENFKALGSVMGSTFINALKPFVKDLNSAMSHVIAFAKVVSNALGKIFGWTYEENSGGIAQDYEDVADSAEDLAAGTGKAADNAKKLKQQLQGFDELNVLTSDLADNLDAATGGTGGAGSGATSGYEGQWKKTGEELPFESDIDTLRKLGKTISETLIDAMESIDWNGAYEKARNFGTGLAEFLNGLFEGYNGQTLFGEVGKTIASALNTVIYSALSFGETFDFKQFGYNIADGINNFFRTFDFGALAKTINVWVDGIFDLIATTIKETDKGAILDAFIDFFGNLELDTVAIVIGAVTIKKIGKVAWGFALTNVLKPLASKFLTNLGATLTSDVGAVLGAGTFSGIAATIGSGIVGSLVAWFGGQEIGKLIGRLLFPEDSDWYENFSWLGESGFFETIYGNVNSLSDLLYTSVIEPLDVVKIAIEDIGISAEDILSSAFGLFGMFETCIQPAIDKFNEFKDLFDDGQFSTAMSLWGKDIDEKLTEVAGKIDEWYTNGVEPWFTKEKWINLGENIKEGIAKKWDEFASWWKTTGVYRWYEDNVKPWFSKEKWNFSGIANGMKEAWNSAIESIKSIWNKFANYLNANLTFTINPIVVSGQTIFSGGTLDLGYVPTFAAGGFPEDGWFRASQGEILGKFDNGQSVVANNNQITDGISAAVQRGNQQMIGYMQEEIVELRKQNEFLMQIAGKSFGITKEQIGENARSWAMEYTMRTGNEAYSF